MLCVWGWEGSAVSHNVSTHVHSVSVRCCVALWEHAACRGGGGHSKQALLLTVWRRSAHEACIRSWPSQTQMEATVCVTLRRPSKLKPLCWDIANHACAPHSSPLMWTEGGENLYKVAQHGFQIPAIHLSLCFSEQFLFFFSFMCVIRPAWGKPFSITFSTCTECVIR